MTLYLTNKKTGEMRQLLAPLHHKPKYKVHRVPPTHYPPRQEAYRRRRHYYRRPKPLEDLLVSLAGLLAAATALSVPFFS